MAGMVLKSAETAGNGFTFVPDQVSSCQVKSLHCAMYSSCGNSVISVYPVCT